jgi:hypothetical protein
LTPLLYRLGHFCARHPAWILVVWLVVALTIVGVARSVGQETNDDLKRPGTDSQAATNLLSDKFPEQANGSSRSPCGPHKATSSRISNTRSRSRESSRPIPKTRRSRRPRARSASMAPTS